MRCGGAATRGLRPNVASLRLNGTILYNCRGFLGDPESVEPGKPGRRGGPAVVVTKVIGGVRYRVMVEARVRQRQVAFVSMFKTLAG
jgi:hypothetical protein